MPDLKPAPLKPVIAVAERADPREIEGRQALFVLNLPPKRMAGEVSEGMLFDAVPEKPVPNGVRAG